MVEAVTAPLHRLLLIIVALVAVPSAAYGHVLDEYLQSTLVVIEPGDIRLKINLTPGVEIAEKVLAQIDPNKRRRYFERRSRGLCGNAETRSNGAAGRA